jgi:hypothetical protein
VTCATGCGTRPRYGAELCSRCAPARRRHTLPILRVILDLVAEGEIRRIAPARLDGDELFQAVRR